MSLFWKQQNKAANYVHKGVVKLISIPKEMKDQMIGRIQAYFEEERDEEIGELGADLLLDIFMKELGPYYYNQGIADAKALVEERWGSVEEDIEALKRSTGGGRYR
ncbi:DUF2164 domain-containing protein [Sutcliffiella horikoshii]